MDQFRIVVMPMFFLRFCIIFLWYVCEQEDASTFSAIEGRSFDQLHLYHYKQTGPSSVMSDIEKTQCDYSTSPSVNNFHLSIYLLINTLVLNYLQLTALTDF